MLRRGSFLASSDGMVRGLDSRKSLIEAVSSQDRMLGKIDAKQFTDPFSIIDLEFQRVELLNQIEIKS